jgi:hypothetical protein
VLVKSIYSLHSGVLMTQKCVAELKQKTGCPLEEWLKRVSKSGPATEKERREWLKPEHGSAPGRRALDRHRRLP